MHMEILRYAGARHRAFETGQTTGMRSQVTAEPRATNTLMDGPSVGIPPRSVKDGLRGIALWSWSGQATATSFGVRYAMFRARRRHRAINRGSPKSHLAADRPVRRDENKAQTSVNMEILGLRARLFVTDL